MPTVSQIDPAYICTFCGNQRIAKGHCEGCGGSSFKRQLSDDHLPFSQFRQLITTQTSGLIKHIKILSVVTAIGFITIATALYKQAPDQTKSTHLKSSPPAPYSAAGSAWGRILNPQKDVPDSGFTAYYLRGGADKFIHKEHVNDIAVKFGSSNRIHNITPRSFAAYWIGKINLSKKKFLDMSVTTGHVSSRVYINGVAQTINSGRRKTTIELDQGEHIVEVEFSNRWHTVDFFFSLAESRPQYSTKAINSQLTNLIAEDYEFLYVSQHESPSTNQTTLLNLEDNDKPVVLLLNSYEPVKWHVLNPFNIELRAVVIGSYEQGSEVQGDISTNTKILHHTGKVGRINNGRKRCQCYSGTINCGGETIADIEKKLSVFGSGTLAGLTINSSTSTLVVPEEIVNSRAKQLELADFEAQKNACDSALVTSSSRTRQAPLPQKTPSPKPILMETHTPGTLVNIKVAKPQLSTVTEQD